MGFLSGSMTFARYEIVEDQSGEFGNEHLETLNEYRIGSSGKKNLLEEPDVGFTGGAHLLDTQFDLEKNVIGEALHFGIRVDSISVPGNIKRAWTQMELAGITKENQGGKPTKAQRDEAQAAVDQRCQDEAAKGNYRRMNLTSVLWDAATGTMYLSSTSEKNNDQCLGLLEDAFGLQFKPLGPTALTQLYCADDAAAYESLQRVESTTFVEQGAAEVTWWNGMTDNVDYLGNEFMLWLWWKWETGSSVMELADETEVSGIFARSLALDCPAGESGKESITSEFPTELPEAGLAIRMGKLPRKAGLTLVREGQQFDLTLQAETFGVNAARISYPGESNPGVDRFDRIESIRQLTETLDLMFESFLEQRIGKNWVNESEQIRQWLAAPQPKRKTAKAA